MRNRKREYVEKTIKQLQSVSQVDAWIIRPTQMYILTEDVLRGSYNFYSDRLIHAST